MNQSLGAWLEYCEGKSLEEIEVFILGRLSASVPLTVYEEYKDTVLMDKGYKWVIVSALQKAIRRGHADTAVQCAIALWGDNASYLVRRLGVIVLEDIGIANIKLCAVVMAMLSNVAQIRKMGGYAVIGHVAYLMATSIKSRAACDLVCTALYSSDSKVYDTDPFNIFTQLASYSGEWKATDENGEDEYLPSDLPKMNVLMNELNIGSLYRYMIYKGRKAGIDEALHVAIAVSALYEQTEHLLNPQCTLRSDLLGDEFLNDVPAASYDQHTSHGKRAISYFYKICDKLSYWMVGHKISTPLPLLSSAIFDVEGMLLNSEMSSSFCVQMNDHNFVINANRFGITPNELAELYDLVRDCYPLLDKSRRRILGM